MKRHVEELETKAFVAQVYMDGEYLRTWYQDGKGSWRGENNGPDLAGQSSRSPQLFIYNAQEEKGWLIRGDTAYEITKPELVENQRQSFAPITAQLSSPPSTGHYSSAGENGIWEWRISQKEQARQMTITLSAPNDQSSDAETWIRFEYLGPEGLLSREAAGPVQGPHGRKDSSETTFQYSQLGDVSPELFELPGSVKETKSFEEYVEEMEASVRQPSD